MKVETASLSTDIFRTGADAPVTFHFFNAGNIDISYLKISILFPAYVTPKSIQNSNGLLKRSEILANNTDTTVNDYTYATSYFNGDEKIQFNIIEFVAKDVSPNKMLQSNIV